MLGKYIVTESCLVVKSEKYLLGAGLDVQATECSWNKYISNRS